MNISIFGLGYVGCVSAACLADAGYQVIGVDVNPLKIETINAGTSPIVEPGLDEIIARTTASGQLRATADGHAAIHETDISILCVGTPSNINGSLDLRYLESVSHEIGQSLRDRTGYHVVVVRSTVLPGTVRGVVLPILERESGKKVGTDFGLCMNPEFLREGSAIKDYYQPSHIVIGQFDERSGNTLEPIYHNVEAPRVRTSLETAEIVKYADNAFHATKVVFANEIGNICKAHGIDGQEAMEIFCQDTRLNLSPYYLKPGFSFGGSCLPKDVRALLYRAKERDIDSPLLSSLLPSNHQQTQRAITLVERTGRKRVGILGLSFKAGTDDVRESPVVNLIETLVGRGYQVRIFDEHVKPDKLIGANRSFLEREIPHIASLMWGSVDNVLSESDVIVIANGSPLFRDVPQLMREDQILIDLVGLVRSTTDIRGAYEGICW